jgi:FkbM family methyltransferase
MWSFLQKLYNLLQFLVLTIDRLDLFWSILLHMLIDRSRVRELLRLHRARWLTNLDIDTVLDIGAYTGGFAYASRKVFPHAHVIAFEPVPEQYSQLAQLAEKEGFTTHNLALGNQNGEISFFQNAFGPSSSALPISPVHTDAFPQTSATREIKVRSSRLDDLKGDLALGDRILLKSDVQGYDLEVLKGAEHTLARVQVVIVEASLQPLYEQQADFEAIYDFLTTRGFQYIGDMGALDDPRDGKPLQIDAVFLRND